MKKFISVFICCIVLAVTLIPLTAFAWETPSLQLNTSYNEKKKEITVEYRINDFAGTESADFMLRYNPEVVEYKDSETVKISNTLIEVDKVPSEDKIAILYANMTYTQPEDCDEDGGKTLATITFKVIDESATETVFIATADSCAMDPDSTNVAVSRYTEKVFLTGAESTSEDADASTDSKSMTKVIIAAVIALVVFVGGTAAFVIKCRKS